MCVQCCDARLVSVKKKPPLAPTERPYFTSPYLTLPQLPSLPPSLGTRQQPSHDEDTRHKSQALKNKSQPPSASVEQPASGGKGKKSKVRLVER